MISLRSTTVIVATLEGDMDEKLSGAIEVLLAKLDEQNRSVIETKKMINSLRQMNGEEPLFPESDVVLSSSVSLSRPDAFYGKPFAVAAREYLEARRRASSAEEIMRGLEQGAFDFDALGWKEKDRLRTVAMSLAKNSVVFHKLPNNTFGLLSWYPEVAKRKPEKEKNTEPNTTEESKVDEAK